MLGRLTRFFLLRGFRCTTECGWRGLRFSRSRYRARKRQMKAALLIVLFIVAAAATVRYMLSRASSRGGGGHDDGIQEIE
jgi:hypothetical protein